MAWYNIIKNSRDSQELRVVRMQLSAEQAAAEILENEALNDVQRFKLYNKHIEDQATQIRLMEQHIMRINREASIDRNEILCLSKNSTSKSETIESLKKMNKILTAQKTQLQSHRDAWMSWCLELYNKFKSQIPVPRKMRIKLDFEK